MYEAHFGFAQAPFGLTPDTRFFFAEASHQEALNTLLVALRGGEGFLKVTGEIGLGKTLVCRQLLNALGPGFVAAYIPNPTVSPVGLLQTVAEELGACTGAGASHEQLLKAINRQLLANAGRKLRTVLVVDEAQALSDETLEAIRLLTNLETETYKLLQVVLFGQPELDQRLAQDHLRQLRQRITFSYKLRPLDRRQFAAYVRHRLDVAGGDAPARGVFCDEALDLLFLASGGTPRVANILCHKALLAGFGPGRRSVGRSEALAAVLDSGSPLRAWLARSYVAVREHSALSGFALGSTLALLVALFAFN